MVLSVYYPKQVPISIINIHGIKKLTIDWFLDLEIVSTKIVLKKLFIILYKNIIEL